MGHADALPPWHRLGPHPCLTACPFGSHPEDNAVAVLSHALCSCRFQPFQGAQS